MEQDNNNLTERELKILESVVRNYIVSAEPTGSRFLSKSSDLDVSAATIRNIMGDLEEKGYITQPHSSAGRVPTDKGYRYYVDKIMQFTELADSTKTAIKSFIVASEPSDMNLVLAAATRALSQATHQLGVVLAPKICSGVFKHVHVFEMNPRTILMHLTIDAGFVRTMAVELETTIDPNRLERACELLNQRFFGLTLQELCDNGEKLFGDLESIDMGIIRLFIPSIKKMMTQPAEETTIYTQGETNVILQPEFSGQEHLGAVIELLGEKRLLMHLLAPQSEGGGVSVSIGGENTDGQLRSFSAVKAPYKIGHMEGRLGIVGPTRMPYPFLISAVDYTAKLLGEIYT